MTGVRLRSCVDLFNAVGAEPASTSGSVDEALFHAPFDLGVVLDHYPLRLETVKALLEAIERLFFVYYPVHPGGSTCEQFWDNVVGYRDWEKPSRSALAFLDGALPVLRRQLDRPEAQVRQSALHGLNHYPDVDAARKVVTEHLMAETDGTLRENAADVLEAFGRGKRLV